MSWKLYDYVNSRGRNDIKTWMESLQKVQRNKIKLRLDMLKKHGTNLSTGVYSDTKMRHIKKIRIGGNVAVRLMLCRGPIENNNEFTLLLGTEERDRKLLHRNAVEQAEVRRQEVINDPQNKRSLHERVE